MVSSLLVKVISIDVLVTYVCSSVFSSNIGFLRLCFLGLVWLCCNTNKALGHLNLLMKIKFKKFFYLHFFSTALFFVWTKNKMSLETHSFICFLCYLNMFPPWTFLYLIASTCVISTAIALIINPFLIQDSK